MSLQKGREAPLFPVYSPQFHCLDSRFSFQVSIAVGLAAFACVLLVVLFIMINKYGRRSKFGMKGTCSLFPLAGGTFQDCQVLIAPMERCCGFIPMLSILVQSLLKRILPRGCCPALFFCCEESGGDMWAGGSHLYARVLMLGSMFSL